MRGNLVTVGAVAALALVGAAATASTPVAGAARAAALLPCADTQLVPNVANLPHVRAAILCLINEQRAIRGVAPLRVRPRLRAVAMRRSRDMVRRHYFSHPSAPGGGLNPDFLHLGLRGASMTGENIAWGSDGLSTARSVVAGWMSSTPHRRNMLARRFRFTGVGISMGAPSTLGQGHVSATYTELFASR
jgi:uncharacterized protein YkwD